MLSSEAATSLNIYVHVFFFLETPKACLLMQGAQSPCGEAVLKVWWLLWTAATTYAK